MITWVLVRKLLRDIRVAWIIAAVLLFLFQILWSRITSRITTQIVRDLQAANLPLEFIQNLLLSRNEMIGQLVQAIIGGHPIQLNKSDNFMSISYVHPLVMAILCIWAIGRAANAIAGEIDRGTMELLLAQPIRRSQIIVAHLLVDLLVFPGLCLVMWGGTYCGTWWVGLQTSENPLQRIDPFRFLPALLCVFGILFSTSGMTMWVSSLGRSRAKVWGWGITLNFCMFLVNVLGQIWNEQLEWMRPLTIFYHYQPQLMIMQKNWYADAAVWGHFGVLIGIGAAGYLLAWATFCRRDLPAPL